MAANIYVWYSYCRARVLNISIKYLHTSRRLQGAFYSALRYLLSSPRLIHVLEYGLLPSTRIFRPIPTISTPLTVLNIAPDF